MQQIEPIEVKTEEFELATAIKLVEQVEQPIIYLLSIDEISKDEFESL